MKKKAIAALVATTMASATPAFAGVAEELAAMKARIAQLEAQLAEQQATMAKQETAVTSGGLADKVTVSGVLEIVANHSEDDAGNTSSDLAVDTFELGIEAELNEIVTAAAVVEYNGDDNDIELLEAFVEMAAGPTTITAGKAPIPVAAVNDTGWTLPLTDDFFDIREGLAMVSFGTEALAADVYAFNNDDGDSVNAMGVNLSASVAEGVTLGAGYVNDLSDGDFSALTTDADGAWRVNALAEMGAVVLSAEYLEISGEETDPTFLTLNAAFDTELATFYLGWSEIDDSNENAERTVVGLERGLGENAALVAEYVRDEDAAGAETDTLNLVVVTEF